MGFDDVRYGGILYKDSDEFNRRKENWRKQGRIIFTVISACFVVGSFMMLMNDFKSSCVLLLFGALFFIIGYLASIDPGHTFIIYESGIRFSYAKIPFLSFSDVDHLEMRKGSKWKTPYISVITDSGREYLIASKSMKYVHEIPENFNMVQEVLSGKLQVTYSHQEKIRLVRIEQRKRKKEGVK